MPPSVSELKRRLEQHGLEDNRKAQKLLTQATNPYLDREQQWRARLALKHFIEERRRYPFQSTVPKNSYLDDPVLLGTTQKQGKLYTLKEDDLNQHTLFIGQTGSGKSTAFRNIMTQISTPYWAFDRKQDYRHLIQEHDDLLVLPWSELKFNPLKPPEGVAPMKWVQVFTEIFSHATSLLSGSKNYLLSAIIDLYKEYNLFKDNTHPYPALQDLHQLITGQGVNYTRKKSNYLDTVANRLEPLTLVTGHIFNCSKGYPIEDLMQKKVVFEFDGLNRDIQRFLQEILFAYVYEHQFAQGNRSGDLELLIFVDEAKQTFSVYLERQDASGIPEIDDLTARARQFGIGLVAADQEATKLTDSLKANTKTKVLLPVGDQKQFNEITESIDLTSLQEKYAQDLDTGQAIIKHGNNDPVPVDLQNHQLGTVTEEELVEHQREKWQNLPFKHRKDPSFSSSKEAQEPGGDSSEASSGNQEPQIELSEESERLLKNIADKPLEKLTPRYDLFSNRKKGTKAKDELVEKELVTPQQINTGSGRIKLLDLTEKARRYLEEQDVNVQWKGRGSVRHLYWQDQIKELLEETGWDAYIEKLNADVYGIQDGNEIAVEVALGVNDREIDHVENHLETGWKTVIAARNHSVQKGLERKLEDSDLNETEVLITTVRELDVDDIALPD